MGHGDARHQDRRLTSAAGGSLLNPIRLHEAFDRWLAADPDRALLHLPQRDVSFGEIGALVDRLAAELRDVGVRAGDRVPIVAENCPEHVALILACSRVGAWSCGVNARMAPGEVDGFVAKADARTVYFTAAESTAAAAHAARCDARPSAVSGLRRSAPRREAIAEQGPEAEQVAAMIFTSGTTGAPKGVLVTHDGLLHFARVSAKSRELGPDDRSYAYLPMTHIFGLGTVLAASLVAGAGLVMRSCFSPQDIVDALARQRVTMLQGPPTLFARLLAHLDAAGIARPKAPHLRYLYTGAGPLDLELKRRVEARFRMPLHHGYGLSEYAGSVCLTRINVWRDDTAAGYVVEDAELRIVDAEGRDLPMGRRGEIWMRGRGLTPGYFRDDASNAAAFKPGGWYASGDLGELAADGALTIVGRLKEMIIRSGFNVYPAEIEGVLNQFPAVQRSAVVGRAESGGNEEVIAFVELRPGARLDRAQLDEFLHDRLAPYKRPAQVHVIDALPMTLSGKVLKRELLARISLS